MRNIFVLVLALALAGCDDVVSSRAVEGSERVYASAVPCTKSGYCFTCMPGYDAKMKCTTKLSPSCPGQRPGTIREWRVEQTFESGKIKTRTLSEIIEVSGTCN